MDDMVSRPRRHISSLAFLCSILCASAVGAQDSRPLSIRPPDGFRFDGSWNCEGTFRNAKLHKATFTGDLVLDEKWLELTEQDVQPATGYVAKYLLGYDSQQKRLVEFDANNFGAAVYSSQGGWTDHVLTMTSPASQDAGTSYALNRFIYSIIGPDTFTVDWQTSKSAAPNWTLADHLACKRSRS